MRLGVYTDYTYELRGDSVYVERAFALFVAHMQAEFDALSVIGRVRENGNGSGRYPLGDGVGIIPLPYYESLGSPLRALPALFRSVLAFWRALESLDAVWLLGPHPLAVCFALIAIARRRRVVLGVRQDFPEYVRTRRPGRRLMALAASLLEGSFRALARRVPVVVVGPQLAANYSRSSQLCQIVVSLIDERSIVSPDAAGDRAYSGEVRVLSVGRLDTEKNPLLMADALAQLAKDGPHRWRLIVCGEGPSEQDLRQRLLQLGLTESAELRGYVSWGPELEQEYRDAHILLHVSRTEGFPQVLLEAFAAGLPVVATDVGGIAEAVGNFVVTVPPDDAAAISSALARVRDDPSLRRRLIEDGNAFVSARTIDSEVARVGAFIRGDDGGGGGDAPDGGGAPA